MVLRSSAGTFRRLLEPREWRLEVDCYIEAAILVGPSELALRVTFAALCRLLVPRERRLEIDDRQI